LLNIKNKIERENKYHVSLCNMFKYLLVELQAHVGVEISLRGCSKSSQEDEYQTPKWTVSGSLCAMNAGI